MREDSRQISKRCCRWPTRCLFDRRRLARRKRRCASWSRFHAAHPRSSCATWPGSAASVAGHDRELLSTIRVARRAVQHRRLHIASGFGLRGVPIWRVLASRLDWHATAATRSPTGRNAVTFSRDRSATSGACRASAGQRHVLVPGEVHRRSGRRLHLGRGRARREPRLFPLQGDRQRVAARARRARDRRRRPVPKRAAQRRHVAGITPGVMPAQQSDGARRPARLARAAADHVVAVARHRAGAARRRARPRSHGGSTPRAVNALLTAAPPAAPSTGAAWLFLVR